MEPWRHEPARDIGLAPSERAKSLRRELGLIELATNGIWYAGASSGLRVWNRLRVVGKGNIPRSPPFIMIANHASHLDAVVLASALPWRVRHRVFPIAAGDVFFKTPRTSLFAAWMVNALPMWRKHCGRHALNELRERLVSDPCGYILFPEGARSRDGAMRPFRAGLGMLVAETNVPVIPCAIDGAFDALKPGRFLPSPRRITISVGEPLRFEHTTNARDGWNEIARTCQEAVAGLLGVRARR